MFPLQPDQVPDLAGAEVFIAAGKFDGLVPVPEVERLAQTLQDYGAQVTFQWQPADHRLTSADISAAHDWIRRTYSLGTSNL
jgi:predicted esterase